MGFFDDVQKAASKAAAAAAESAAEFTEAANNMADKAANAATATGDVASKGAAMAKSAFNKLALEKLPFMENYISLCSNGWNQGWHEANAGNLSYRLSQQEAAQALQYFDETPGAWVTLDRPVPELAFSFFVITGSGKYLNNVAKKAYESCGIIELNSYGDCYRIVWGLTNGGKPTSELSTHLLAHAVCAQKTNGENRVIYHAHPANVVALTQILPLETKVFTQKLWRAMAECIIMFPEGVGVIPFTPSGNTLIADKTTELMKTFNVVVWPLHGVICAGSNFDTAFGLMQTIDKAAGVYAMARMMNGGSDAFLNELSNEDLVETARNFNISHNPELLED